jgi:hypothetical protein
MYGPVVNDQASSSATATVTSAMKIRVSTGDISRVGPSENPPETGRFVDRSAARARPLNA